jgi:hypothetical protein
MTVEVPAIIQNQGQIKSMELPPSWQLIEDYRPGTASPSYVRFGPAMPPNVELYLFYPGRPLPGGVQEALRTILSAKEGQLTAKQIESLSIMLREATLPDAFNFLNARSQDWNGKRVIIVEGRWNQIQQDRFWMFIPHSPDCETHQEVWFQAPVEVYPAQLKFARQALNSIQWTD